ncbi:sigma-70 family RNA polymerase sigma factor [candidate division KSB1 bacterium]|nr:sigma-70 family RNA polymerase sigma factor [candidate division KSB1 bacterium]
MKKTDTESEHRLIRRAKRGDLQAFQTLVEKYEKRVLGIAYQITGDPDAARDIAQDVFLRLYRFLSQFQTHKRFFTWLYRITVNASYDYLKRERRFRAVSLDELNHEPAGKTENPHDNEMVIIIKQLIDRLSTPQKTKFVLRELEGFSCKEIVKIMDCPGGTVRSYLFYARKHLKEKIRSRYPEFIEGCNYEV